MLWCCNHSLTIVWCKKRPYYGLLLLKFCFGDVWKHQHTTHVHFEFKCWFLHSFVTSLEMSSSILCPSTYHNQDQHISSHIHSSSTHWTVPVHTPARQAQCLPSPSSSWSCHHLLMPYCHHACMTYIEKNDLWWLINSLTSQTVPHPFHSSMLIIQTLSSHIASTSLSKSSPYMPVPSYEQLVGKLLDHSSTVSFAFSSSSLSNSAMTPFTAAW